MTKPNDATKNSDAKHCSAALCRVDSVRKQNSSLALRMQRVCEAYDNKDFDSACLLNDAFALAFQIGQLIGSKGSPSLKVTSAFGDSRIEVSDGVSSVSLGLTKDGVEMLISELQTVLDMAED